MTPDQFRAIRERCGHSPQSLAAFLRVTASAVHMIERGDRRPGGPVTVLMELLDAGRL